LLDRGLQLEEALNVFEVRYVRSAVARHSGNLSQAAAALGIHRNTLRAKLQRNGQRGRKST
jgi:DNA-binding NtrC family response regulator